MRICQKLLLLSFASLLFACNQSKPGQNTSDAGTKQSDNSVNSDMENDRAASDVDTITSPGSNSENLKTDTESTTGKTDSNIKKQGATHADDKGN